MKMENDVTLKKIDFGNVSFEFHEQILSWISNLVKFRINGIKEFDKGEDFYYISDLSSKAVKINTIYMVLVVCIYRSEEMSWKQSMQFYQTVALPAI